jgi:hypothetical protein
MTVPALLPYAGDFRSEAVEASQVLLAPVAGDAEAVTLSSCTRIHDDANDEVCRRFRRAMRFGTIFAISIGMLAVLVGGVGMLLGEELGVLIAVGLLLGVLLFSGVSIEWRDRKVRRLVSARGVELTPRIRCIRIENALTYNSLKVVPEDLAMVCVDPARHCVRLEGLSHRYIIYAADVTHLAVRRMPGQCSTAITYRIGAMQLALTLAESQSNVFELLLQAVGRVPRLHRVLVEALTAPPPAAEEEILDAIAE